jgi:hypothetical protein
VLLHRNLLLNYNAANVLALENKVIDIKSEIAAREDLMKAT